MDREGRTTERLLAKGYIVWDPQQDVYRYTPLGILSTCACHGCAFHPKQPCWLEPNYIIYNIQGDERIPNVGFCTVCWIIHYTRHMNPGRHDECVVRGWAEGPPKRTYTKRKKKA